MKRITKQQRMQVYEKYNGHCAYCGRPISYNEMQVDHLKPARNYNKLPEDEIWNMDNYMPACRTCNHYKRANSLEGFRQMIQTIPAKLERDSYIYRVGVIYGNVIPEPKKIKFYFEKIEEEENEYTD